MAMQILTDLWPGLYEDATLMVSIQLHPGGLNSYDELFPMSTRDVTLPTFQRFLTLSILPQDSVKQSTM